MDTSGERNQYCGWRRHPLVAGVLVPTLAVLVSCQYVPPGQPPSGPQTEVVAETPVTQPAIAPTIAPDTAGAEGSADLYRAWEEQYSQPEEVDGLYGVVADGNGEPADGARIRVYVAGNDGWTARDGMVARAGPTGAWRIELPADAQDEVFRVEIASRDGRRRIFYPAASTIEEAQSVVVRGAVGLAKPKAKAYAAAVSYGGLRGAYSLPAGSGKSAAIVGKYGMAVVLKDLCESPAQVEYELPDRPPTPMPPDETCATNTCLDAALAGNATVRIRFTVPCDRGDGPVEGPELTIGQGKPITATRMPATFPGEYTWELPYGELQSGFAIIRWVCKSGQLPQVQRVARFVVCDPTGRVTDGADNGLTGQVHLYYVPARTPSSAAAMPIPANECVSTSNSIVGSLISPQWNKYAAVTPLCGSSMATPVATGPSSLPRTDMNPVNLTTSGPSAGTYSFTGVTRGYCYCVKLAPTSKSQEWSPLVGFGTGEPLIDQLHYQYP
jgi:hypothetical protein